MNAVEAKPGTSTVASGGTSVAVNVGTAVATLAVITVTAPLSPILLVTLM